MADEEDAFEERAAITKYERGFPLLACDEDTSPNRTFVDCAANGN
jgi:hypothetical protein